MLKVKNDPINSTENTDSTDSDLTNLHLSYKKRFIVSALEEDHESLVNFHSDNLLDFDSTDKEAPVESHLQKDIKNWSLEFNIVELIIVGDL